MGTGNDQPRDGNILSLEQRTRASEKMDRVETYWNSIRGKRLVPSRCEVDPRGLEGVLGHAFILERIAGGLARFRIAGSHLTELTGLELRQMPLSALFLPGSRDVLADALQTVFDEPATVRMRITSPAGFGRDALEGELILLPLRSDLGDIDRILGALVFDGKIGRTPRRIEIANQTRKSLTGYAGPQHANIQGAGNLPEPRGPLLAPVVAGTHQKPAPSSSHLRLVVSND